MMHSHTDATPISFPVEFQDLPWVAGIENTTRKELVDLFGRPTGIHEPNDPGPIERWAFRYECGLQLVYQLHVSQNQTLVYADIPEIQHVSQHLPFARKRINLMQGDAFAEQIELALKMWPERKAEFDGLYAVQVWRQGDDGNPIPVGSPTSERAAKCRVAELESHKHKQTYWFESLR